MAHFFREPDRRQRFLLPVDMLDWLPKDDIVHLIVEAVDLMDLSGFEATCKVGQAGQAPFAPRVLLALLIYAYAHGVRSSRAIERLCGRDAGYRFIVGQAVPDHTVIARFRRRHIDRMKNVFRAVLELCREAGLIHLGLVALDGAKIKANAALDANRTAGTIEAEIARMLQEAEATDTREDRQCAEPRGDALPKALARATERGCRPAGTSWSAVLPKPPPTSRRRSRRGPPKNRPPANASAAAGPSLPIPPSIRTRWPTRPIRTAAS